ncbi:MAG: (2Fe-2S)-binding protein [Zhaonellaceae bacterium]|jgi:carbon-monoxide dehydrogenase small subunit|nr:(2Fe-2S)-binding protein [Clostridia bacterium]
MPELKICFNLNGREVTVMAPPDMTLLELLREKLDLTGTKKGCEIGECGACTVIINKKAVNSCMVLVPQVEGTEVITVEGLSQNGELDSLQQSFIKNHAIQCGFCTPGMLMSAKALLMNNPNPTKEEIKEAISGNLCRCTGYIQIIKAIASASK